MCDSLNVKVLYPEHAQLGPQHLYYPLTAPNLGSDTRRGHTQPRAGGGRTTQAISCRYMSA